jgi:CRISPR-associated endonuclease Cas3-HD
MSAARPDLTFWGKAQPREGAVTIWHPVAYHLLDVAAVADAILAVRPLALARAASLLGLEPAQARRLLVALIALHDLGKFGRGFQVKRPDLWPAALGPCRPDRVASTAHTVDGYALWRDVLRTTIGERLWPGGRRVLDALAPRLTGLAQKSHRHGIRRRSHRRAHPTDVRGEGYGQNQCLSKRFPRREAGENRRNHREHHRRGRRVAHPHPE